MDVTLHPYLEAFHRFVVGHPATRALVDPWDDPDLMGWGRLKTTRLPLLAPGEEHADEAVAAAAWGLLTALLAEQEPPGGPAAWLGMIADQDEQHGVNGDEAAYYFKDRYLRVLFEVVDRRLQDSAVQSEVDASWFPGVDRVATDACDGVVERLNVAVQRLCRARPSGMTGSDEGQRRDFELFLGSIWDDDVLRPLNQRLAAIQATQGSALDAAFARDRRGPPPSFATDLEAAAFGIGVVGRLIAMSEERPMDIWRGLDSLGGGMVSDGVLEFVLVAYIDPLVQHICDWCDASSDAWGIVPAKYRDKVHFTGLRDGTRNIVTVNDGTARLRDSEHEILVAASIHRKRGIDDGWLSRDALGISHDDYVRRIRVELRPHQLGEDYELFENSGDGAFRLATWPTLITFDKTGLARNTSLKIRERVGQLPDEHD